MKTVRLQLVIVGIIATTLFFGCGEKRENETTTANQELSAPLPSELPDFSLNEEEFSSIEEEEEEEDAERTITQDCNQYLKFCPQLHYPTFCRTCVPGYGCGARGGYNSCAASTELLFLMCQAGMSKLEMDLAPIFCTSLITHNFVCPAASHIDCAPSPGMPLHAACLGEYHNWVSQHCNVYFTYGDH